MRNKVYIQSSAVKQYLYEDPESGKRLQEIAGKYDLHKGETYKTFAITVGDIILGFYRIEDTVPLLQQELGIDPRTAALLGADVLDFLAPLSDPNWQPPTEEVEGVDDADAWASDTVASERSREREEEYLPPRTDTAYNTPTQNYSVPAISATIPTTPEANNAHHPNTYSAPEAAPAPQFTQSPTAPPAPQSSSTDLLRPVTPSTPVAAVTPVAMPDTVQQRPAVAPYPASPNAPLHTMAGDMYYVRAGITTSLTDDEPTYRSQSQDALRQPLSTVPAYTPAPNPRTPQPVPDLDPPRWSSQS